jgi:hypothetical protein
MSGSLSEGVARVAVPDRLIELIDRFERNLEAYRSPGYKEAQLRQEFVDPFLELLGWDVSNKQGAAPAYKEVVHEDTLRVGASTKAPDYSLRIGGTRKLFVETKKPAVGIKEDPAPALQLRRYGWNAKLPLCILTNFAEFAIYDTRIRPKEGDNATTALRRYLKIGRLAQNWGVVSQTFSRQAVLNGSFDKYAESWKDVKGTQEVDRAFLDEIETWRDRLARNLAIRNAALNQAELNFAVQATIDRIVFLRICEDRGIETYGRLQSLLTGPGTYGRLKEFFRLADERYNSGLFYFGEEKGRHGFPDHLTPNLEIDDEVLKNIVQRLYFPRSPYEFSILPTDILGQVYEQFLGKVVRLTPTHRAIVEEKPEVKKAGGVYYTPSYIVKQVVEGTLGRQVQGKTLEEVAQLRIVDPACGSGSFLLAAYQFLLDWHLNHYVRSGPRKHRDEIFRGSRGAWFLTSEERKRILLNSIYGVDIDPQAVEVTKLSLLLKVLEHVSGETIDKNQKLFHHRALPDLENNVKCGNSLIGPAHIHQTVLDESSLGRVNPFDWKSEFESVYANRGGFDGVIGNPPYIRVQTMSEWAPLEVELYKKFYKAASKGNYDAYVVFVERALDLVRPGGVVGFILPHKFFNVQYGEPLRALLSQGNHVSKIVHFGDQQVFPGATTYTCLLFLQKSVSKEFRFVRVPDLQAWKTSGKAEEVVRPASSLTSDEWHFETSGPSGLLGRLMAMQPKLLDVAKVFVGLQTSADKVYVLRVKKEGPSTGIYASRALLTDVELERAFLRPLLKGAEISRYAEPKLQFVVIFPYRIVGDEVVGLRRAELADRAPRTLEYLRRNQEVLMQRSDNDPEAWWLYPYPKNLSLFGRPKILCQVLSSRGNFALDQHGEYCFVGGGTAGGYAILDPHDNSDQLKFLLAILNSKLTTFFVSKVGSPFRGGFYAFGKASIGAFPIPRAADGDEAAFRIRQRLIQLADAMVGLHKKLSAASTDHSKNLLERQVESLDRDIDALVCQLYRLSPDEIKEVEAAFD